MKTIKPIDSENLKISQDVLKKYYESIVIPAEKKPYLVDHKESTGPYMAISGNSVGYIQDAASQIATLGLGFNSLPFFGVAHLKEAWTNDIYSENSRDIIKSFKGFLKNKMNNRATEVIFTNSGAESNEVALGLAYKRRKHPTAKKVIAFEGSFHGRFLISLFSTWNKSKREPFQIKGYETSFIPFPEIKNSNYQLEADLKWLRIWEDPFCSKFSDSIKPYLDDEETRDEVSSLLSLKAQLESGEHFAVIVEPMQCEGGDRYGTSRFFNALVLLCKSYQTEVIMDEVQTGFYLGREFFWHQSFKLQDSNGIAIFPEYISCAKKAQTGILLTTNGEVLESNEYQLASLLRGYYHALAIDQSRSRIAEIEEYCTKMLKELVIRREQLSSPRACGLAFAFDLSDDKDINKFIEARFKVGLLYYNAGSHTLRFRLNTAYKKEDINFLFEQIENICDHIYDGKDLVLPTKITTKQSNPRTNYLWHEKILSERINPSSVKESEEFISKFFKEHYSLELVRITKSNFKTYKKQIEDIQKEVYEPARQTEIEKFQKVVEHEPNISLGLIKEGKLVAISFAGAIGLFPHERGLRQVKYFNDDKTLYMLDTTTVPGHQNQMIGRFLKYAVELLGCSNKLNYIYGRNRDQLAGGMLQINLSLGAIAEVYLREDYPDDEEHRDVYIYRSPLVWQEDEVKITNTIPRPNIFGEITNEFISENIGELINKICLSNFVSETFLENLKYISTLVPQTLRHIYTTSGQAECVDKIYKAVLFKEEDKTRQKVISFRGHYFGSGSFMSRSISEEKDAYFPVSYFDHPTQENEELVLKEIEKIVKVQKILAIFIEPSPQKLNNKNVSSKFLVNLSKVASKNGVKIVYNISSQMLSTSFLTMEAQPDAMMAYLGGQMGVCYMSNDCYVDAPLMLISTWDGDSHSLAQFVSAKKSSKEVDGTNIERAFGVTEVAPGKYIENTDRSYKHQQLSNDRGPFILNGNYQG